MSVVLQRARERLQARTRLRRGAARLARRLDIWAGRPCAPSAPSPPEPEPEPAQHTPAAPSWDPAAREVEPDRLRTACVTERLYARLDDDDRTAIEAVVDEEQAQALADADDTAERRRLLLAYAVHHAIESVLTKTRLTTAQPPDDVHAMSRGPAASGGSYYYADLVADALAGTGLGRDEPVRVLDFGCSSGRVVRVLAAAYPEAKWFGCDPLDSAIAWARRHLDGIEFAVSPEQPPLPYPDDAFDAVFAISIWSHYGERTGVRWLEEMRRVVRPGGTLMLTTHGLNSIAHYRHTGERIDDQLLEIAETLHARGFWFAYEFDAQGDWGIVNPEWGTAFFTPEWLLRHACPRWAVHDFAAGRLEDNQDAYVLVSNTP